jgi:multidrug resistance protein MdtO
MRTVANLSDTRPSVIAFLRLELAPKEGRGLAVARIAAGCVITVAIAMVFRVPLAAYMAYIVFLISKDDIAGTAKMAIAGTLAITLAVIVSLCLAQVTFGDPAIRLPAMALITFLAMFSARTFALGPVSFLAGFVVVTMQSIVDQVPNPEVFTRTTLWLWVVVVVPVAVTMFINLLFGPVATVVAEQAMRKVLSELEIALAGGHVASRLREWRSALAPLADKAGNPAGVWRMLETLVVLESYPDPIPAAERAGLIELVRSCLGETQRESSGRPQQPLQHQHEARRLFVPDAMTNPIYWQFALKTTIAIMIVYSVYSLLNWPGLLTSIVTVFFVALGSVGETIHKLTLRLLGAIVGGSIAGLSIVFILPHFTDIGQLCVLVGAVALFAAWFSTSSERLSYAGMQIALAFFMGMLQTYSPATDLTVLRDRVVGILLGNVVMTLVFSTLWPESILTRLREELVNTLRSIAALLRSATVSAARRQVIGALTKAENCAALSLFEMQMLPTQQRLPSLRGIERLAGAAFVASSQPIAGDADMQVIKSLGSWLDRAAECTAAGVALPSFTQSSAAPNSAASAVARHLRTAAGEVTASAENSPF